MKYLGIILLALIFACEPELKPQKPANLISKSQMTDILYDMFVINAAKGANRKTLEQYNVNPEQYILEKHGIDSLQFALSNNYYAHNIALYTEMIDTIRQRLMVQKTRLEVIQKQKNAERNQKRDSLKQRNLSDKTPPLKKD